MKVLNHRFRLHPLVTLGSTVCSYGLKAWPRTNPLQLDLLSVSEASFLFRCEVQSYRILSKAPIPTLFIHPPKALTLTYSFNDMGKSVGKTIILKGFGAWEENENMNMQLSYSGTSTKPGQAAR